MQNFDKKEKEELISASYASPKKRAVKALHPPEYSGTRILLVCMQPESYVKPHMHSSSVSEAMTHIQGDFLLVFFNNYGRVEKFFRLNGSENKKLEIPPRTYHTLIALEKDSILFESSQGPYNPETYLSYSSWGPIEEDKVLVKEYLNHLKCLINCIFCRREEIKQDILFESDNFFVKVGFGLVAPGHVMLVTKEHYSCFADIPDNLLEEAKKMLERINLVNMKNFGDSFIWEAGAIGQSVFHAHMHIIPKSRTETKYYRSFNFKDIINEILSKLNIKLREVARKEIIEARKKEGGYTSLEDNGKIYLIGDAADSDSKILNYRDVMHKIFGLVDIPSSWPNMSKEMKNIDEFKRETTKETWKDIK